MKAIGKIMYIISGIVVLSIIGFGFNCIGWQFWIAGLCVFISNVGGMLEVYGEKNT